MEILTPLGHLVIGETPQIPVTLTNPMFNDKGGHSLPFSIPWCELNLQRLGYPNRLSRAEFLEISVPASIKAGDFKARGQLSVVDITENDSIELSFSFDNGSFWEWAKQNTLPSVAPDDEAHAIQEEVEVAGMGTYHGWYLKPWLMANYVGKTWHDAPFTCFPVCIENDIEDLKGHVVPNPDFSDYTNYRHNLMQECYYSKEYHMYKMLNKFQCFNATVEYNFTGFIFVRTALNWIMNKAGFRWDVCQFDDVAELDNMVIINNALRPFRDYLIHYSEMLPNISVNEFINSIEKTLGCVFFFNEFNRTVSVKFWKKLLNQKTPTSINGSFDNQIVTSNAKNFGIVVKPSNHESCPTLEDLSVDEIKNQDNYYFIDDGVDEHYHHLAPVYQTEINEHDDPNQQQGLTMFNALLRFFKNTQSFYHRFWEHDSGLTWNLMTKALKTLLYPYRSDTNLKETEKIEPKNLFGHMVKQRCLHYQYWQYGYNEDTPGDNYYHFFYYWVLPFCEFTSKVEEVKFANHVKTIKEADDTLSFMFYRGKIDLRKQFPTNIFHINSQWDGGQGDWLYVGATEPIMGINPDEIPWGSTDIYSPNGEKMNGSLVDYPNLLEANIALRFNSFHQPGYIGEDYSLLQFYKEYEAFITSGHAKAKLYSRDIKFPIDFSQEYICDNVKFFIDKADFTITPNGITEPVYDVIITKRFKT